MHNLYSHLSKFSNQLQEFVWTADPQTQAKLAQGPGGIFTLINNYHQLDGINRVPIPKFQISQILLYIHWDTATGKFQNVKICLKTKKNIASGTYFSSFKCFWIQNTDSLRWTNDNLNYFYYKNSF